MNRSAVRVLTRITSYLLILFAVIFTLALIFLSQLDINDYRLSLEQQLSSALNQPVQIGYSSLTFNRGLALALNNLQIGPDHAILADIPHITATLKIPPLINGQFILDQVQIENPKFKLWLPFPERPTKGTSQRLINSLGIRALTVRNGNLKVFQKQNNDGVLRLELANLHAILRGWKPEKTGQLVISGQVQKYGADFLLETRLPSSRNPDIWRNEELKTQLTINRLSTKNVPLLQKRDFPGTVDLNLRIQGVPSTGTTFTTTLSGSGYNEQIFSLSGRWISSSQQDSVTKLKGELLKIPLSGEFHFIRQAKKYFLGGHFGAENLALSPELLEVWHIPNADKLIHGELDRLIVTLKKSWAPVKKIPTLPRIDAKITIGNLEWDDPQLKQLEDLSVELSLENKTLSISDGIIVSNGQNIDFTGEIINLFQHPQLDLTFTFNPHIDDYISQLDLPADWDITGNIPGVLNLTGALFNPDFQLQTDLNSTKFQLGTLLHKQPTDRGTLQIRGHLAENQLQLDHFSIKLNNLDISGSGYFQPIQGRREYRLAFEPISFSKLKPFSPLLRQLQIKGQFESILSQRQTGLQGTLWLKNVGAHLTSVIGDLNRTSGEVNLDSHGFTFQNLQASLGKSDFTVNGVFNDWKNPQLNLDLKGKKVRAQDLIFSNPGLTLYDLDGHLQINADGIRFSPVKVRLEENTLATVNGTVSNFSNPQVSLDIQSDRVDVLDIINLFIGPDIAEDFEEQNNGGAPLLIKISAKQGTLGGLIFQNAEALIKGDNNRLIIFPLTFDNGKGWSKTRIELDYGDEITPLKVSGHVEEINASVLHQDIFEKPGLINGRLRGDFYLEGDPGSDRFWQEAKGGIYIQVRDGTLKKFHGLAKVFSLLNVSQIISGKLPDMDKDGMPFTLMEGSFQVAGGKIKTEDLKITSEAMNLSVVGTQGIVDDALDFDLGVMPLRTVDKIITSIPIAGWVLAGKDKALITAQFKITGTSEEPQVSAVPIGSVSKTVFGIFKRTLGLPGKLVKDIGSIFKPNPEKKIEP
ncbi:MAG: AsmA-like C-terminal domain-containing protein [Thermodesulfobacteriota bacterium]|nr:AsmA-like C-terminal domain-containing protein [Thermodesulfobacteriota bacterium]